MEFMKLFPIQKELDDYILDNPDTETPTDGERFEYTILALLTEIGEMANETRVFKFWSTKGPSERDVVLEEHVDVLHFILSLGNQIGFYERFSGENIKIMERRGTVLTEAISDLFHDVLVFRDQKDPFNYLEIWDSYKHITELMGFDMSEVKEAYYFKNKKNYTRQKTGY